MSEVKQEAGQPQRKRFTLVRRSMQIEVENLDGKVVIWTLREMIGAERDQYLNAQRGKVQVTGKDTAEVRDFTNLQGSLLALCLYDENDKLVDPRQIQLLPASMQSELYDEAMKLSGLDPKAKEEAKNELRASALPG